MSDFLSNIEDTASPEPEVLISPHTQRYATQTEWETVRPILARLYFNEHKTLKDVMAILAQDHGHRGTQVALSWYLTRRLR